MLKASLYFAIILTLRTEEAGQNNMFYVLFSCWRQLKELQSVRLAASQSLGLNVWDMSVSKQDSIGTKIKKQLENLSFQSFKVSNFMQPRKFS